MYRIVPWYYAMAMPCYTQHRNDHQMDVAYA